MNRMADKIRGLRNWWSKATQLRVTKRVRPTTHKSICRGRERLYMVVYVGCPVGYISNTPQAIYPLGGHSTTDRHLCNYVVRDDCALRGYRIPTTPLNSRGAEVCQRVRQHFKPCPLVAWLSQRVVIFQLLRMRKVSQDTLTPQRAANPRYIWGPSPRKSWATGEMQSEPSSHNNILQGYRSDHIRATVGPCKFDSYSRYPPWFWTWRMKWWSSSDHFCLKDCQDSNARSLDDT